MKVLFVTRKFPPQVGGMERAAGELYEHLSLITEVRLIKWGGKNLWLPLILPYFLLLSLWIVLTCRIDCVYLQDGLLAPLGIWLKILGKPVVITIHGLDITYKNRLYQSVVPRCIKGLDKVIYISDATLQECLSRGIPMDKTLLIPWGVSDRFCPKETKKSLRDRLAAGFGIPLGDEKILLSVGRLVKRKGFHWFVEEVMPVLRYEMPVRYVIVGEGEFRGEIEDAIRRVGLGDSVVLLGRVGEDSLPLIYGAADLFVMPNIPVQGNIEGFGLVALEASSSGLPVIASDIEGISEAISDGENGFLIPATNAEAFVDIIMRLLRDDEERIMVGKRGREFTLNNCGWDACAQRYLQEFHEIMKRG